MEKYKKFVIPTMILSTFIVIAIPLSIYILSLPLSQIADEGCRGFSGYHLTNCIAYYQREGHVSVLQHYANAALWLLWIGLFIVGVCSFFVFPLISFTRTLQVYILVLGLLITLLLACLPLILFAEPVSNGFIFAFALVIGLLAFELAFVSSTKKAIATEELILYMP